jgi:hypothetical protein
MFVLAGRVSALVLWSRTARPSDGPHAPIAKCERAAFVGPPAIRLLPLLGHATLRAMHLLFLLDLRHHLREIVRRWCLRRQRIGIAPDGVWSGLSLVPPVAKHVLMLCLALKSGGLGARVLF